MREEGEMEWKDSGWDFPTGVGTSISNSKSEYLLQITESALALHERSDNGGW